MASPPISRKPAAPNAPVPTTTTPASSAPLKSKSPEWVDVLLFWFDWSIKVLGIAAAVVFGIWAPLSYEAANKANDSDDVVQQSMIKVLAAVSSQASMAAAQQTDALDAMNRRIGAIGQLRLLEFCEGHTTVAACRSFTSGVSVPSLVSYLASTTSGQTSATDTSRPTSTSTISPVASTPKRGLSLPVILGIVFAVILFLGIVAGIFISQLKRLKRKRLEEE
ncbi:hypothetical protein VTL71DRAFT_2141 [Oculimacula yallundae]|uniref:Polysaccharide chain length determinant N-terminal domain-containing protein n=1 Tax=Oculimacula yallundae TaxID=86028 RepID=A0ABR4C8K9_9HELO